MVGIGVLVWRQLRYLQAGKIVAGTKQQQDNELLKKTTSLSGPRKVEETSYFELRTVRAVHGERAAERQYQELVRSNESPTYENVLE